MSPGERERAIFGNALPPTEVWERQFDYDDEALKRIARTPWSQIEVADLWYYIHDLAYSELQPELFAYLFPACLVLWRESLMRNEDCGVGDAQFQYAVVHGRVFEKMMTDSQRDQVFAYFNDAMLDRLDLERGFVYRGMNTPAYGWMRRLGSLGVISPAFPDLWRRWWAFDTPGRAVAALEYATGLIYGSDDNPVFLRWTREGGGGGPYLNANDSGLHDQGWRAENLAFMLETLTLDYLSRKVPEAAEKLAGEPEAAMASRIRHDLPSRLVEVDERIVQLLADLESGHHF